MAKQRFTAEVIIHKLREADVLIGQVKTIGDACKALGVTDKTYFRWRKTHGGLRPAVCGRTATASASTASCGTSAERRDLLHSAGSSGRDRAMASALQLRSTPQRTRLSTAGAGDDCGWIDGGNEDRRDSESSLN